MLSFYKYTSWCTDDFVIKADRQAMTIWPRGSTQTRLAGRWWLTRPTGWEYPDLAFLAESRQLEAELSLRR